MARFGKCINFGLCSKADAREALDAGMDAEFACPECGKLLVAASGKSKGGGAAAGGSGFPAKKAGIAGVGVLALLGGAYFLMPADEQPPPVDPPPLQVEPVPPPIPGPVDPPPPTPGPVDPPIQPHPDQQQNTTPIAPPIEHRQVIPPPRPPADPPVQQTQAAYSGLGSGTIVWEGNVDEREMLVTIDGNTADKGQVVSGGVPGGVPLVLSVKDPKNVGIAFTPQATTNFRRMVLRVRGKGKRRAVVDWSVAQ